MPIGTITPSNNGGTTTIDNLQTSVTATVASAGQIQSSALVISTPLSISTVVAAKTLTPETVSIDAADLVDYTPVLVSDEVSDESLNRTAETLKADVNNKLTAWAASINASLTALSLVSATEVQSKITSIDNEVNALISDVNTALETLRQNNISQADAIALAINTVSGDMLTNDSNLQTALDTVDAKIRGLNDVYSTDADFAARVTQVNDFMATLNAVDVSFVEAVNNTMVEVNNLTRLVSKTVTINSASGMYSFVNAANGLPTFADSEDFDVQVNVIDNDRAQAHVENKTATGFNIVCRSLGRHYIPQPFNGTVTSLQVLVRIVFKKTP